MPIPSDWRVPPGTWARWLPLAVSSLLIFGGVAFFQLSQRADLSNLAGYPDEASHFVTGVCLLDYCRKALGTNPLSFAESYYAHYPKVAFGHWPPVFYVLQALWYGVLGVSTLNALLLVGCITATASLILFLRLRRLYGTWIASLSICAFLWLPVVRRSTLLLMSDMLTGLFTLLAILAFCDGWIHGRRRYWLQFALWTLLAIGTKESGLTLLVFALIALPLLGGKTFLGRRNLYLMAIGFGLVLAVTLFLYAASGVLHSRDQPQAAMTLSELWQRLPLLATFAGGVPVAMILIAAFGAAGVLAIRKSAASRDQFVLAKIALIYLLTTLASQLAARTQVEDRYFLAAYFPLAILFAQGLSSLQWTTNRITGKRAAGFVIAAACAILSIVAMPGGKMYERRTGYAEIAAAIPFDPRLPAILVSSDASGEGSFLAERLIRDSSRDGLVLRASKMLSNSDFLGNRKLLTKSIDQVHEFLDGVPVRFIVLDMNGFIDPFSRAHHRLLEDTLRRDPEQFRLIGNFPLYFDGRRRLNAVQVYENLGARPNPRGVIRIDMANSLGRNIEIPLTGASSISVRPSQPSGLPLWLTRLRPAENDAGTAIHIAPDMDRIPAWGGWGRIYVTAPPVQSWQVRGLPAWLTTLSNGTGYGNGTFTYRLEPNETGEVRWAIISVGDRSFRVVQPGFPYIYLPSFQPFSDVEVTPPPEGYSYLPKPSRWHLQDLPGGRSKVTVAPGGPGGDDCLIVERPDAPNDDPLATSVYYSGIDIDEGATYRLSLWMRAQHPSQISVRFGQSAAPYNRCGLDQPLDVASNWTKVNLWFHARGEGCGRGQNRFFIEAGRIDGKLWLSQVSLHRESLQSSGPEQSNDTWQSVPAVVTVLPPSDHRSSAAGSGKVRVSAPSGKAWAVKEVPSWLKITGGRTGTGRGAITYTVEANTSGRERSTAIEIGDAVFEIMQTAQPSPVAGFRESQTDAATVTLDKKAVKIGEELEVRTDEVPPDWSGELMVNSLRRFAFNSKLYRLKATVQNGFNDQGPTDIHILLKDSRGRQIPVNHDGRFLISVKAPDLQLDRDSFDVESGGASGRVNVTAANGNRWSVGGVPDWIKITSGAQGSGKGTVSYRVEENTSSQPRSATLTIGDSLFEISQLRPAAIQLPFYDDFHYGVPPPPVWKLPGAHDRMGPQVRWAIVDPARHSSLSLVAGAPKGGNSVLIEKQADPHPWTTMIVMPHINVKDGRPYKVSLWMKAENPGPVSLGFEQSTDPYRTCGFFTAFTVTTSWAEYAIPFRVTGNRCEADNNRVSIGTGQIGGKLWIANFSMIPTR